MLLFGLLKVVIRALVNAGIGIMGGASRGGGGDLDLPGLRCRTPYIIYFYSISKYSLLGLGHGEPRDSKRTEFLSIRGIFRSRQLNHHSVDPAAALRMANASPPTAHATKTLGSMAS